jgi:hypothetical protein
MKKLLLASVLSTMFVCNLAAAQCNDGLDNDGDGLIDFGNDLSCVSAEDQSEHGTTGTVENGWTIPG